MRATVINILISLIVFYYLKYFTMYVLSTQNYQSIDVKNLFSKQHVANKLQLYFMRLFSMLNANRQIRW